MVRERQGGTKDTSGCKRKRPTTPAPKHGWLLAELAELAETRASTVRYYVQQRLVRPIERRGTATRYERREFLLLLALLRLRVDNTTTLTEKKQKLDAMGDEQLEQWLRGGPLPAKAAKALGFTATQSTLAASLKAIDVGVDTAHAGLQHWQRITLLPGLELMLREDALETTRITAQRIVAEFVG